MENGAHAPVVELAVLAGTKTVGSVYVIVYIPPPISVASPSIRSSTILGPSEILQATGNPTQQRACIREGGELEVVPKYHRPYLVLNFR